MNMRFSSALLALTLAAGLSASAASSVTVTSYSDFEQTILHARAINVTSYVLSDTLISLLQHACSNGAHVDVLLAAPGYDRSVVDDNSRTVETLRSVRGCNAQTTPRPLHMKLVYADRSAFLSDTNFSNAGFLVRVDDEGARSVIASTLRGNPARDDSFATRKDWALELEQSAIAHTTGPLCVSTESFGRGQIAGMIAERAGATRLVVSEREESKSPHEQALLSALPRSVDVRIGTANEKIAVGSSEAWFGSANATSGLPQQIDWGMVSQDPTIVTQMQQRCLRDWQDARPYR